MPYLSTLSSKNLFHLTLNSLGNYGYRFGSGSFSRGLEDPISILTIFRFDSVQIWFVQILILISRKY